MNNYFVLKVGVYLQGVFGPYPTQDDATIAAGIKAKEDKDDYHSWQVRTIDKNGISNDILFKTEHSLCTGWMPEQ